MHWVTTLLFKDQKSMAKAHRDCPECEGGYITKSFNGCNRRETERRMDYYMTHGRVCDDCVELQRSKERDKAAKEAADKGLPDLIGSDGQVKWAITIRHNRLNKLTFDWFLENQSVFEACNDITKDQYLDAFNTFYSNLSSEEKSWEWIDARDTSSTALLIFSLPSIAKGMKDSEGVQQEVIDESTIRSTDAPVSVDPAEVVVDSTRNTIIVNFPHRFDPLISVMHEVYFEWNSRTTRWELSCREIDGSVEDRAAEVVNTLLTANFIVTCVNSEVREKALTSDFEPRYPRWMSTSNGKEFTFDWFDDNLELLSEISSLSGRKSILNFEHKRWTVPSKHFEAVQDIMDRHQIKVTKEAQTLLTNTKMEWDRQIVRPTTCRPDKINVETIEPDLGNVGVDVSLLDD